jgi:hypothetical protein
MDRARQRKWMADWMGALGASLPQPVVNDYG